MAKPAFLEAFEVIDGSVASAPSDEWVAGHAAGMAEGLLLGQADQQALSAELVQTLADMSFGYHEARDHMARSLEPLFAGLIDRFVPGLATEMLVPTIAQALFEAARTELDKPIAVNVSPVQFQAVESALAQMTDVPFVLIKDPGLSHGQVTIEAGQAETLVDFDELISQAQRILSALIETPSQRSENG